MADEVMPVAKKADTGAEVVRQLRDELKQTKLKRDDLVPGWEKNVDKRRGKDFDSAADEGRVAIPIDWAVTKAKAAQLFSQMPQVRLTPKQEQQEQLSASVPVWAKEINTVLEQAGIESVVNDCVLDCINAAGVAAAIVRYEALTTQTEVPALDPLDAELKQQEALMTGVEFVMPMKPQVVITDRRFCIDRVSPANFLWPTKFQVSDWHKAPWLGHSGQCSWPQAKRMFGLKDEQKDDVLGAGKTTNVTLNENDKRKSEQDMVSYDEIFYWRHIYHEDETYYDAIQRVVFVAGIDEPVINEPWKGQQFDQANGGYLGSCRLPIQVLTLAYISDEAIPPSDSAIIRPQVEELEQARKDMKDQRKHSKPLRWFNVDQVDPTITKALIDGTWQGMIPVIGQGDRIIGEVSRTAYPRENMEFDRMLKADIQEAVSVGPNQSGNFATGERSAREAEIVQNSFQTEVGQQRARVAAFIVGIAEVVAGLYALYGERAAELPQFNQKFLFDIRPDSTVRLDAQQLVQQLTSVLNVTAQSGFINPKPLIKRIIELNGLDPAEVMVDPTPKGPEPPKIAFSFKGEDVLNPVVWAICVKAGMAPEPKELLAAQKMLHVALPSLVPPPPGEEGSGGAPAGAVSIPMGDQSPDVPGLAFPQWESNPRINTRRAEG